MAERIIRLTPENLNGRIFMLPCGKPGCSGKIQTMIDYQGKVVSAACLKCGEKPDLSSFEIRYVVPDGETT